MPTVQHKGERRVASFLDRPHRSDRCQIDARTLRAFLLFLYGTGALGGEACWLLREDVNFKKRLITIRGNQFSRLRQIPICPNLYRMLGRYHATSHKKGEMKAAQFFLNKEGNAMNQRNSEIDLSAPWSNCRCCPPRWRGLSASRPRLQTHVCRTSIECVDQTRCGLEQDDPCVVGLHRAGWLGFDVSLPKSDAGAIPR